MRFVPFFFIICSILSRKSKGSQISSLNIGPLPQGKLLLRVRGGGKSPKKSLSAVRTHGGGLTVSQRLISGGISRALAQMTLYPIDALRTLAQTRDGRTLADVGAIALVRGCATTSSFALLLGSIQFSVFGLCRSYQIPTIISSAVGAAASCLVGVPQEVIKQRLITGIYGDFRSAVTTIWSTEGIRGFYTAWKPTVGRNVPNVMTIFTVMELVKRRRLKADHGRDQLTVAENVLIGMGSALVGSLVTQPFDVVKTRMTTQAASNAVPYASAWDCLLTMVKTEGPTVFYAGLKQRGTYMCLLWGMTFALNGCFERIMTQPDTK